MTNNPFEPQDGFQHDIECEGKECGCFQRANDRGYAVFWETMTFDEFQRRYNFV